MLLVEILKFKCNCIVIINSLYDVFDNVKYMVDVLVYLFIKCVYGKNLCIFFYNFNDLFLFWFDNGEFFIKDVVFKLILLRINYGNSKIIFVYGLSDF